MAQKMLSFHGKQSIKTFYLRRLETAQKKGTIIRGQYWDNGQGCAIGSTIHSYDYEEYPKQLGLPVWIAELEEFFFEILLGKKMQTFPIEFLSAIPVGVEMEPTKWRIQDFVLRECLKIIQQLPLYPKYREGAYSAIRVFLRESRYANPTPIDLSPIRNLELHYKEPKGNAVLYCMRSSIEAMFEPYFNIKAALYYLQAAYHRLTFTTNQIVYSRFKTKIMRILKEGNCVY